MKGIEKQFFEDGYVGGISWGIVRRQIHTGEMWNELYVDNGDEYGWQKVHMTVGNDWDGLKEVARFVAQHPEMLYGESFA